MSPKIAGCCSRCDAECFEVLARFADHERKPGEPKRLGPPLDGAVRVSFRLLNGTIGDFTFCAGCAEQMTPEWYSMLWQRNLAGYLREQEGNPEIFKDEFNNGILCEVGRTTWKELSAQ